MNKYKIFFSIGFFREIIHTTLFVYFAIILLPRDFIWPGQNISFILILAAGYLIIPAGYLFLIYDDTRFKAIIQLLQLVKFLRILIAFLIIIKDILAGKFILLSFTLYSFDSFVLVSVSFILFFDLIFLYFLLSYKKNDNIILVEDNTSLKAIFTETEVKDELKEGAKYDNPADSQR